MSGFKKKVTGTLIFPKMSKISSQRISKFTFFVCVVCVFVRGGGGKERHAPKPLVERYIALQPTMLAMQA